MSELTRDQIDRLVAVHRRTLIALAVAIAVIVAGVVVLAVVLDGSSVRIVGGGAIGVVIGGLLTLPERRLHARLGISQPQAQAIIRQQRRLRQGLPAIPSPAEQLAAARSRRRSGLIVLLAGGVTALAALPAAVILGGRSYGEGESQIGPVLAFLGVIGGGIAALIGLVVFNNARRLVAAYETSQRRTSAP